MQLPRKLSKDTAALQSALAEVCRTGAISELPGTTSPGRIATYRSLIHGNFEDTLASAYPITKDVLRDSQWNELVDSFIARQPSKSPQLWQMPEEFCRFAISGGYSKKFGLPYLDDLMRFEWIEIEVFMMEDLNPAREGLGRNLEHGKIVINREYRLLTVEYPVFEKISAATVEGKGRYPLITFRNPDNLQVEYMAAAPLVLELLKVLGEGPLAIAEALDIASSNLRIEGTAELHTAAHGLVTELCSRGMILGTVN